MKLKKRIAIVVSLLVGIVTLVAGSSAWKTHLENSLLGPDTDQNGVRDDIDDYIQTRYAGSEKKRAAMIQMARDYQTAFRVLSDPEKTTRAIDALDRSILCFEAIFGDECVVESHSFLSELLNNYSRSKAWIHVQNLLFQKELYFPAQSMWIKECRFNPEAMKN